MCAVYNVAEHYEAKFCGVTNLSLAETLRLHLSSMFTNDHYVIISSFFAFGYLTN